jgi:hypothetical protein
MNFTSIDRVGIELEGGWNTRPANAAFHYDGSVSGALGSASIGEMVSAPMSTWDEVAAWITAAYPETHDRSCGYHIHVSFKSRRAYARLMDRKFFDYFTTRMEGWGRRMHLPATHLFWSRLAGLNRYCQKNYAPDTQVAMRTKGPARYAQLNYCFQLHGTIECRLAPVFKQARVAVAFALELLSTYEDFLAQRDQDVVERVEGLA